MSKKNRSPIKRELINKKYYWTLRNKGKIVERRKWSPKKEVKDEVFSSVKQNFSLRKNNKNTVLVNVIEKIKPMSSKVNKQGVRKFKTSTRRKKFAVQIILTDGKNTIHARSDVNTENTQSKTDQAIERALGRYNREVLKVNYNGDESSKLIGRGKLTMSAQTVYYAKV